jgi:hypothetical protein
MLIALQTISSYSGGSSRSTYGARLRASDSRFKVFEAKDERRDFEGWIKGDQVGPIGHVIGASTCLLLHSHDVEGS